MDAAAERAGIGGLTPRGPAVPPRRAVAAVLVAAALLVPLLALGAGAAWSWRSSLAEATERQARILSMLHEHARRAFEVQEVLLVATARHFAGRDLSGLAEDEAAHGFLREVRQAAAVSGGLGLVRPDGRLAAASYAFPAPPIDLSDRDYVRAHRDGQTGTHVGEVVVSRPRDIPIFALSRPILDPARGLLGIVGSGFAVSYFTEFYAGAVPDAAHRILLVRGDGTVLARHPPAAAGERLPRDHALLVAARDAEAGVVGPDAPGGEPGMRLAFHKVAEHPVLVAYGLPLAAIRAEWRSRVALGVGVAALSSALLVVAALWSLRATGRAARALEAARRAAESRAEIEARLRHAQRLEALGQLTSGVAHEVNNLLTVVRGAGGALRRAGAERDERTHRYLDALDHAVERGQGLTRRLLSASRREAPRHERLDLSAWLPAQADTLRAALRDRAVLALEVPPGLWPVRVDAHELEAALINLAANARDALASAGHGGGRFLVAARNAGPDAVEIACADDGPGMPGAVAARAFEPFFTTKPAAEGTGLGLPQVAAFAADAGGDVQVETAPGAGTRIRLLLPRDGG